MSSINVTLSLSTKVVEAEGEAFRLLLQSLPDEIASDIRSRVLCALDSGRLQIVFDKDASTVRAGAYHFIARWVGLDYFLAAARRAADGEVDVFHGDPSQSGFDGCGDCDSTAGADPRLFSNRPSS